MVELQLCASFAPSADRAQCYPFPYSLIGSSGVPFPFIDSGFYKSYFQPWNPENRVPRAVFWGTMFQYFAAFMHAWWSWLLVCKAFPTTLGRFSTNVGNPFGDVNEDNSDDTSCSESVVSAPLKEQQDVGVVNKEEKKDGGEEAGGKR